MIPADDPARDVTIANAETHPDLNHFALVGDVYTPVIAGSQTRGRYALIEMHIPPGGGPPPHRHDFDELFYVLEGTLTLTFRHKDHIARPGDAINIPANAPHCFKNNSSQPARLLCFVSPAGLEAFFESAGERVPTRTSLPAEPNPASQAARLHHLSAHYQIEIP